MSPQQKAHQSLAGRIRKFRNDMGLSREAFAERYGISSRTLQEWEQGRREPDGPAASLLHYMERDAITELFLEKLGTSEYHIFENKKIAVKKLIAQSIEGVYFKESSHHAEWTTKNHSIRMDLVSWPSSQLSCISLSDEEHFFLLQNRQKFSQRLSPKD